VVQNGSNRLSFGIQHKAQNGAVVTSGNLLGWEPCAGFESPIRTILPIYYHPGALLPHVSLPVSAHGRFSSVRLNKNRPIFPKNRRFNRIFSGLIAGQSFTWIEPAQPSVRGSTGRIGRSGPNNCAAHTTTASPSSPTLPHC